MTNFENQPIVFGAFCTWWGIPNQSSQTTSGVPCCPFCGSPLYRDQNKEVWDARLNSITNDICPNYKEMFYWQHDQNIKCSKSWKSLQMKYSGTNNIKVIH